MAQRQNQEAEQPKQQIHDPFQNTQVSVNEDGRLHTYCRGGKFKKVEGFIRTCSDLPLRLAYRRGVFGYTPIHEAASYGHSNVLELLLQHGGDPNCRANCGYTPLHVASSSGHVDCVRVLLANDADIICRDEYGKTPMQTAELSSKHGVLKVLRSAGKYTCCVHNIFIKQIINWLIKRTVVNISYSYILISKNYIK